MIEFVKSKVNFIVFIIAVFSLISACSLPKYSLSGASIHPDAKTVSIQYIQNNAPLVNPQLSQELTEALKDKFVSQTNLSLINREGDLEFSGEVINYQTKPMAIQENDIAALNRLTITIRIKFVNKKDPDSKYDFDKTFSRYDDYQSDKDLSQVEGDLIVKIIEELVEDIFNESVVNW